MFRFDKYQYSTDKTFMAYRFISNGPKGAIQKIAKFNLIGKDLYNFGFGDLNAVTGEIYDTVISDNKDVDIIMGTGGSIIYDFTNIFPQAMVSIQGTNKARTREIELIFDVFGVT